MGQVSKKKHGFSVFSVFFTFFIDNLGITLIFPILAPLFLNPEESIISPALSQNVKSALLGLFLGAYPLAQFLFAPIVGEFADHFGRKLAFLITTAIGFCGYVLCAFSIAHHWIILLFVSRLIMGIAAGNMSICLSTLSDLSDSKKTKVRYFGIGSVLAGITFVLGPFLGGKLSDPAVHPAFSLAFPLWIGVGLSGINWLFLLFAFIETLEEKSKEPFDFAKGVHNIQCAFKTPGINKVYAIYFFYLLSWNMLFQFIPAFLVTNFAASNSSIGDMSAIMGLCWILGNVLLYKVLLYRLRVKLILILGAFIAAVSIAVCAFLNTFVSFISVLGFAVLIASFGWPLCTTIISEKASKSMQGRILGLSQSVQSLAMMLAPLIVGPFLSKGSGIPFYISAGVSIIFGCLVIRKRISE